VASWAGIVLVSVLSGIAILWIVGGWYHVRYYVLRRHEPEAWKCQPTRFLRPDQQRQAMLLSTLNLAIGGVISGTFIWALTQKGLRTPIYFDVGERGWAYFVGSTLLLFVLVDGLAYYAHRALHAKAVFRYVHRWHHRYIATTPFVTTAMHPVEFLVFQAVTFLPLFVIPFHYVSVIAVFVYILVFNIVDHSGVKLRSIWPWQASTLYHDDHHAHFHCNFGQHLQLWDRLHGTLRRSDRRYGEHVFGGKGEPVD
jgi:Delta7-sterol 5-desaturase